MEPYLHEFLTLALEQVKLSVSQPCRFIPRERASELTDKESERITEFVWLVWRKYLLPFLPIEPRFLDVVTYSYSLHWLAYADDFYN